VFGDPGGEACYRAASSGDRARSALDSCDAAIQSGRLRSRDLSATLVNRGIIHSDRGELNEALADYLEARRLTPGLPESYVGEGNVRFLAGQFQAALDAYDEALEMGLSTPHAAHFNLGLTYEQLGRWDEAEAAYREAASLAPEWPLPPAHIARVQQLRAAGASAPPQ
jgi:tetratricopeptide (TPR) repeat protein